MSFKKSKNNDLQNFIILLFAIYALYFLIYLGGVIYSIFEFPKAETIIIPPDYIGVIYIVYEQKHKSKKQEYEGENVVYRIPQSGIYETPRKHKERLYMNELQMEFYFLDKDSCRIEIPYLYHESDSSKLKDIPVWVMNDFPRSKLELPESLRLKSVIRYRIDTLKNLIEYK